MLKNKQTISDKMQILKEEFSSHKTDLSLVEQELEKLNISKDDMATKMSIITYMCHPDMLDLTVVLSNAEINIIASNMNTIDYNTNSDICQYPRFIDLENISINVKKMKDMYNNWTLIDLTKIAESTDYPPKATYKYVYADKDNQKYTITLEK